MLDTGHIVQNLLNFSRDFFFLKIYWKPAFPKEQNLWKNDAQTSAQMIHIQKARYIFQQYMIIYKFQIR